MTAREKKLIASAYRVFAALERVGTWGASGGKRAEQAHAALDKARAEWETLTASMQGKSAEP